MRCVWVLIAVVLAFWPGSPAAAQDLDVSVIEQTAQAEFPDGINFRLQAESSEVLSAVSLLYGSTRDGVLIQVDVPISAAQRIEAEHYLDTQVAYLPPGTELSFGWVLESVDGRQFSTPLQQLVYHDQRFNWQERSERGVTIYWYNGNQAFGDRLMETTIRALDRLERDVGVQLAEGVRIYVYGSDRDMRSALPPNSTEWIGGQAHPNLGIIVGMITPNGGVGPGYLLPHELSHLVLHQATRNPYGGLPIWFDEGLAVYNQEVPNTLFAPALAQAARNGTLIPLEALGAGFPADPQQATLSYAQSESVVRYILDIYGSDKATALVEAFRNATPTETALRTVLGVGIDELDAEWRATLPPATEVLPTPAPELTAPEERFAEPPVLPGNPVVAPANPVPPDDQPGFPWNVAVPTWGLLLVMALSCFGITGLLGLLLVAFLRRLGVDRQA